MKNYDKYKLATPEDYGGDYVSNCCGARVDYSDRCQYCLEYCEPIEDYEFEAIKKENYLESREDARREERY